MPKHYNENIVLYENVATTTTAPATATSTALQQLWQNMKTFSMKINGQRRKFWGARCACAKMLKS